MTNSIPHQDQLKRQAALAAVEYVKDGMTVGLGTGSTAKHVVALLGKRVQAGLTIRGVPTSDETATLASRLGISLLPCDGPWDIDVAIDGADQASPQLDLIKGGGGALLREKIVAAAARQFIVVVDQSKQVPVLGISFPLPIEIVPFGWQSTARHIETLGGNPVLRTQGNTIFTTESGNYILDLSIETIDDPAGMEARLNMIPGVVENGLFVGKTSVLIVGTPRGVDHVTKEQTSGSV